MKKMNLISAACVLFALLCLPAVAVPAVAQWGGGGEYEEPGGNKIVLFAKSHPVETGAGLLAAIFIFFALIMGPANLFDALLRTRRQGRPLRDLERGFGAGSVTDKILDDFDDSRRGKD